MSKLTLVSLTLAGVATAALASSQVATDRNTSEHATESAHEVILSSEVKWEQLNPARGEMSPKAGTLWGDRNGSEPTGFLVEFVDGFSSPPHIHNVSYRGVVISGLIHNDDPGAADMWMPTGSFWTQPKGEVHITAAKGSVNVAYIEIEEGPYLVHPPENAFDSGERPINVDASNIVWIDQPGTPASAHGPKVTYLWGNPQADQLSGSLVKLPAGFTGEIRSHGSTFRAVVVQGCPRYHEPGKGEVKVMDPGSYFSSVGESVHQISSQAGEQCTIYVRTEGPFDLIAAETQK